MSSQYLYAIGFLFVVLIWLGFWNLLDEWRVKIWGSHSSSNGVIIFLGFFGLLILLISSNNL